MKDFHVQFNQGGQKKLSPVLLFEQHTDPAFMLMIKNNFNQLIKMGYKALLWEYNPDLKLDALIDLLRENLKTMNALLAWLETFGLEEAYLLKANDQELLSALQKTPLQKSEKILFCETISQIAYKRALFELLILCKQSGIDYYGLDWIGTNRRSSITFEEVRAQDFMRESCFAKNISQYADQYNGGIICIMGSAHYPVQKRLMRDPLLQPYTIKSFLKNDPGDLLTQILRIEGCLVNNQSEEFDLGVLDYSFKTQSEMDEVFLKDLQPVAKSKIYPTTVHHFFQEHISKINEKETDQIEKMVLRLK